MLSKLNNMLLPQMLTIHEALSAVEGASEKDIDEITEALVSEGFSSAEPVEGLFKSLDLALLKLKAKQHTIAQIAQKIGECIACMGHHAWHLGMTSFGFLRLPLTARKDHGGAKVAGEPWIIYL